MNEIIIRPIAEKDNEGLAKLIRTIFEEFDARLGNSLYITTRLDLHPALNYQSGDNVF